MFDINARACLAAACAILTYLTADAADLRSYTATVVRVTDGDTIRVLVPAWRETPFASASIRIAGIDAPETRKNLAKCEREITKGKAATAYAKTLLKPGDTVRFQKAGTDKYQRVDANVILPDGRDFATTMLEAGYAKPYAGKTKPLWCE